MAASGAGAPPAGSTLPQIQLKGDGDSDSDNYPHEPQFDNENELLGHPAGAKDVREATALVRRYYAAAAAGDGAMACRLIYTPLAESVAADYGGPASPPGTRGDTCAAVLTKLFAQRHAQLAVDDATLRVNAVRVRGKHGSVRLIVNAEKGGRYLVLHRERGDWKLSTLFDVEWPVKIE